MKTQRRLTAALLLAVMLLSLFGGSSASAAGPVTTVTTDREIAYEPLAQTGSIAYEQHEDGYTVSLDRAADSVTMDITGVPGSKSGRAAEKARLYIRTGVELKPGTAYRVSFSLSAEQAQPEYTVCFDGGSAKAAYGTLSGRGIEAGGTDQVKYLITPRQESGELVLRLLLGKTDGNVFRFSNLAVEKAPENETGENAVLTDKLDYSAPGFIRFWTNDDSKAAMTSDEKSATLTVTQAPTKGAEVWKIKLLVATGLKPEAGKSYRVRADVRSTSSATYEVCYNAGETEKGYDVLYDQRLTSQNRTLDRRIHVPADAENPGELIIQLSLGRLSTGSRVTVSNVRVEEATPKYTNALPKDFALDGTWLVEEYDPENMTVTSAKDLHVPISWNGKMTATSSGDTRDGEPIAAGNSVTQKIKEPDENNPYNENHEWGTRAWNTRLNIDTGEKLKSDTTYRVSYRIKSDLSDHNYPLKCGTGFDSNNVDNKADYGEKWFSLNDENVSYVFDSKSGGPLLISLWLGETGKQANTVTVSDIKIEEVEFSGFSSSNSADVTYPNTNLGTFHMWKETGGVLSGDGHSATLERTKSRESDYEWGSGLIIEGFSELEPDTTYRISYNIDADQRENSRICFNNVKAAGVDESTYGGGFAGGFENPKWAWVEGPFHYDITTNPGDSAKLLLRIDLGNIPVGAKVTMSDIHLYKLEDGNTTGDDLAAGVVYPKTITPLGSFEDRTDKGHSVITGNGTSASMFCAGEENGIWQEGLFVKEICTLSKDTKYQVSFKIESDENADYQVSFIKDGKWDPKIADDAGRRAITDKGGTFSEEITAKESGKLWLRIEFGDGQKGKRVTVSDIKVQEPVYTRVGTPITGSFSSIREELASEAAGWTSTLSKQENGAVYTVNAAPGKHENYYAKLFIDTGMTYQPDKNYRVLFDIVAEKDQQEFVVIAGGVDDNEDIRGTWGLSLRAGQKQTVATRPVPAGKGSGALGWRLELGRLDGTSNTFTISNVRVEEVQIAPTFAGMRLEGTATFDSQPGYRSELVREKDSVSVDFTASPAEGAEVWKAKLFLDTGVDPKENEDYRVTFDVLAENDTDFEVCYNRNNVEKGFDGLYGLHAAGGKVQTIEKIISAAEAGSLKLQLSLGMVKAPNKVTVSNIRVERVAYSYSGKSALPAPVTYKAPGAVSYWAHEDYHIAFTGSDKAIMANITPPMAGAEPWKVKLFLDTGTALKPGKYYRVTAHVSGTASQNYEICYNNGGAEMGYDALGGLFLVSGKPQTVEQIIFVPADKKDAGNLVLQFNLGKTTAANAVTVSGVKVEEVALSYVDMLSKDFSYTGAFGLWTNPDCTATLEGSDGKAVVHVTGVPAAGAEVWKVQLKISTGAVLSAGKTYLVRADLLAAKGQNYEVCFNNEETEKGFDVLYGQEIAAGVKTTVERKISVPASMTDAGELILQFSVGGPAANDITVSGVSVQELNFGTGGGGSAPGAVIALHDAAGTLDITREKLTCKAFSSESQDNAVTVAGANLCAGDLYTVAFTARANKDLTGTFALRQANGKTAEISEPFQLTSGETAYSFTTKAPLPSGGLYDLLWQFGFADNQKLGSADVEISNISVYSPAETLKVTHSAQNVTVNGKTVKPDAYSINGANYYKLRDLAVVLTDTDAQFVVRQNRNTNTLSLTTGKAYVPLGGELTVGADRSASCVRNAQNITVNGSPVRLKAYSIGGDVYFRLIDLDDLLGFQVTEGGTTAITSPLTPEAQEKVHAYDLFFLPEADGDSQPYVGDTMPFYDNGTYYIYYLKDGGDSYNHSVYVATTRDFVHYTELDNPVLSASRADVQDSWIGTGSVVKVDKTYYFFYTGYNASGSHEYHEKIMVAKGSSPTSFEKVSGWSITPPASLGQKNDFRDPQAYYDPTTQTISLTVTASQEGKARILKYTLGKDLQNVTYDGIIFTDPTGAFWNLECSDTFRIGNKWYLTYSGQEDTLWYAMADSRFGPYTNAARLEGKLFYAGKHVENGKNSYMVGWARRANSASSTQEVAGWAGNIAVQKLQQQKDGTLTLVPVDSIVSAFKTQRPLVLGASGTTLTAGSGYSYKKAFTSYESFMLKGEFTYSGTGSFGLAFDFNGKEEQYKLVSLNPADNTLSLSLQNGAVPITETRASLTPNQAHTFTYIQDGSIGIFYLDNQAALLVRLYGATNKPIYLFAENNSVAFTSLRQYTR